MKLATHLAVVSLIVTSTSTQAVVLPNPAHISEPDAYGYHYIDSLHANGPTFNFIDITGNEDNLWDMSWNNAWGSSNNYVTIPVGFNFSFYGVDYTNVYFSNNGFLSFQPQGGSTYTNKGEMGTGRGYGAMISPFWSIGDNPSIEIRSKTLNTGINEFTIIQVDQFRSYYNDPDNTSFQIHLFKGGSIEIHYRELDRSAARDYSAYYQRNVWGIQNAASDAGLTYFDGKLDNRDNVGTGDLPLWFTDEVAANGVAVRYTRSALNISSTNIKTDELGATGEFDISLVSSPSDDVTITLEVSNALEGELPTSIYHFDNNNWNIPQTVTVHGVDDDIADGDVTYSINADISSDDSFYNGTENSIVTVKNADDEVAGFAIEGITPFVTSEGGLSATFTVSMLSTAGIDGDITLPVSSSNNEEGTVNVESLVFNNSTFSQQVTITGVDDLIEDGDVDYQLIIGGATVSNPGADSAYIGLTPGNVNGVNKDNDFDGFTVDLSNTTNTTDQGGATSFRIRLNTQPSEGSVLLVFGVSDSSEAYIYDEEEPYLFTSENWNVYRTVVIGGRFDDDFTSSISDPLNFYKVTYDITTSSPEYQGMVIPELDELTLHNFGAVLDFLYDLPDNYSVLEEENDNSTDDDAGSVNPLFFIIIGFMLLVRRKKD